MDLFTISLIVVFLVGLVIAFVIGFRSGSFSSDRRWEDSIPEHRKDAIMRSRTVLSGQFSEQLAPYLPDFHYSPTECKFLGKPVDFIVFKGMDGKYVREIVFVEVKSGNSKLSEQQKSIKKAIEDKRVRWEEYRIPEDLTKNGDDSKFI